MSIVDAGGVAGMNGFEELKMTVGLSNKIAVGGNGAVGSNASFGFKISFIF